ncbi:MAG TPA: PKD domain-containing protein, partial [Candidatus Sulfotelmatobacter sp.]|nr:PKD domain-containing protein [Candidatus Sulfotelmatobacter sp.]
FHAFGLNPTGQIAGFGYTPGDTAAHAVLYSNSTLTDLGTFGGVISLAYALNGSGQVVGEANFEGDTLTHAFLYSSTNLVDLGTLGGSYSTASALNDAGQIVGRSYTEGDASLEAFLYANGSMTSLGDLGGGYSEAVAINQKGSVIGDSYTEQYEYHGFLYTNGTLVDLGTLGGSYSSAWALNEAEVVVGESSTTNGTTHAFLYAAGVMSDLGTLGGSYSSARAINAAGQIIGQATTANQETHGFLYTGGSLIDLGTLGGTFSSAFALNRQGQVVGEAATPGGASHAFLWQDGALTDLNSLLPANSGWELTSAQFINDAGQIVGYGLFNGLSQWFLLNFSSPNRPPVALAGADQTVSCEASAILDGRQSSDPDGDTLSFEWRLGNTLLGTTPLLTISLPLGTNVLSLTVSDPCGDSTQATVTVRVVDTTLPTLSCPAPLTVPTDAHCQAAVPNLLAQLVASDNCTPQQALSVSQSPAAGTLVGPGQQVITFTVTDASGNTATGSTLLTVVDTTAPVVTSLSATPNVLSPPNHQLVPIALAVVASDNCDAAPISKILSITCNEVVAPGDIQITGPLTATLAASKSSSGGTRVYTITVECTDASGNRSTATVAVSVPSSNGNGNGNGHAKNQKLLQTSAAQVALAAL